VGVYGTGATERRAVYADFHADPSYPKYVRHWDKQPTVADAGTVTESAPDQYDRYSPSDQDSQTSRQPHRGGT